MNTKTMEGIVGANTNRNLLNTPMRVYKEARRRGDTGAMERAMGYAVDFADRAEEYKAEAEKGMEEDAREAREKAREACEKAIRKRREERKAGEERVTGEVGKTGEERVTGEGGKAGEVREKPEERNGENSPEGKREPVTYTRAGTAIPAGQSVQSASISISI